MLLRRRLICRGKSVSPPTAAYHISVPRARGSFPAGLVVISRDVSHRVALGSMSPSVYFYTSDGLATHVESSAAMLLRIPIGISYVIESCPPPPPLLRIYRTFLEDSMAPARFWNIGAFFFFFLCPISIPDAYF